MKGYDIPAVVIGGGVNGLGVIRNLGRNGIDVYCAVDKKDDMAIYSKYCKGYFIYPGVENDLQVLNEFLKEFEKLLTSKAVLFPTSDISVLNVSKLIDELHNYEVVMPKREVLETLIVKRKFYESLEKMGIPHPTTLYPDRENIENIKLKLQYPVFIKPSVSPIFAERFPGKKGFIANSERELHHYLSLVQKYKIDVVIQEIIQGPVQNIYAIDGYFDKNSKPVIFLAKHILRSPTFFANPYALISIPLSEVSEMKDALIKYLTSINYRGLCNIQFKKDSRDKIFKLLEINARSAWYNSFSTACGMNFILTAYLEAIGKEIEPIEKYETEIYGIYLLYDLLTILTPSADLDARFSFRKRLSSMIGRKHFIDFARDDPKPFLTSLLNLVTNGRRKQ